MLGKIYVDGMSREELTEYLVRELSKYLQVPIVTVQFVNFRVSVMGEVKNPGVYKFTSERITLLEALASAGDLQINAKRQTIKVIREKKGEITLGMIDLTSSEFINSEFYYLQQNDVIIVDPNKGRVAGGNMSTFLPYVLSGITTLVTVLALIIKL